MTERQRQRRFQISKAIKTRDFHTVEDIVGRHPQIVYTVIADESNSFIKGPYHKRTPLDEAFAEGSLQMAQLIWAKDGQLSHNYSGREDPPVHTAARRGYIAMLRWGFEKQVLSHDALETKNFHQWTPFDCAISSGNLKMAQYLWEMGGRPNLEIYRDGKDTPVHQAVQYRGPVNLEWIFAHKFVPLDRMLEIKNSDGRTLLDLSIFHNNLKAAKFFWENGGKLNPNFYYRDREWNIVHYCASRGRTAMLRWIFEEGVVSLKVLHIRNNRGRTPLDVTIECDCLEMATFLRKFYMVDMVRMMWLAKRDCNTLLRKLPDELLDMIVEKIATGFNLV